MVSLERLEAQIDMLRLQEHDACYALSLPETKPGMHHNLLRALDRIRGESERLRDVLRQATAQGRQYLPWNELSDQN